MIRHKCSSLIWLFMGCLLAVLTGCTVQTAKPTPADEMVEETILRAITAIDDYTDVKGQHLRIESTGRLLFTVIKQGDPPAVTFYFHNTEARLEYPLPIQFDAPIKSIELKPLAEYAKTLRMDLILTEDVPYEVGRVNNHLQVTLPNRKERGKTTYLAARIPEVDMPDQLDSEPATRLTKDQPAPVARETGRPRKQTSVVAAQSDAHASKYSGEPITLNVHDADIRNVFKILADVSGQNFAIDKDVTGRVTLTLDKPVPWDQVLDLVLKMNRLEKRVEDGIIRIATHEALILEDQARAERQKVHRAFEDQADLVTEYITANYADVEKNIKPHLEAILTKNEDGSSRGTLSVDTRNNILIITDVPKAIERAKEIVRELDRVTPQVLIEARVVEATTDLSQALGISWSMAGGIPNDNPNTGIGPQRGFGTIGGTYGWDTAINFPVANAPTIGFNFSRILGSPFLLDMQLSALEEQGSARIISSPRILTLDNQEAFIQQGEEYPYRDTKESTDGTTGVVVTKFKDIDLKLKVRPHITPDQRISMKVFIEKKDIAGFVQTEAGTLIPRINNKKAETEFLMNDGETIVIGGINRTTERISQSGLPLLSRIPILGWLFKTKTTENNKEELLIFITPNISRLGQKAVTGKPAGQTITDF